MRLLIISMVFMCLAGCVTVNEQMLRKVIIQTPEKKIASVEIRAGELIQKFNGEGNGGLLSNKSVLNAVAKSVMIRWKDNNIIENYGFSGELGGPPDYTLTFSGVRNEDGSIAGSILSGLTMMIIPSSSTITYDLNLELVNNSTKKAYNVKATNGSTLWIQILLLPALPFSMIGAMDSLRDIADYSYVEFSNQGAFRVADIKEIL